MGFQEQFAWIEAHRPFGTVFGLVLDQPKTDSSFHWIATLYQPSEAEDDLIPMFSASATAPMVAVRQIIREMKRAGL